jgi:membrane protease YdiL (CAAX protease family)
MAEGLARSARSLGAIARFPDAGGATRQMVRFLGRRTPVKKDWAALLFAMVFPTIMAWFYFVAVAGESRPSGSGPSPGPNLALQVSFAVGKCVQFGFPLVFLWLFHRHYLKPAWPNFRGLAFGLGFGLLVGGAIFLVYQFGLRDLLANMHAPEKVRTKVEEFGLNSPAGFLLLASFVSLIHSALEEYYWRWFVFGRLRLLVPVGAAVAVSGLAFMGHHVIVLAVYMPGTKAFFTLVLPFSLCIAMGGAVWAWLYQRTGSIYSPWVSHVLIDAGIMAVGYAMLFGEW